MLLLLSSENALSPLVLFVQPPKQKTELTTEQARTLRRKHWPDQLWDGLIASVVDDVFSTGEVDKGTMHRAHLNSANRMRWLCERTMRSDMRMGEISEQQKGLKAKVEEVMGQQKEMIAQQKATMEKLDAFLSR